MKERVKLKSMVYEFNGKRFAEEKEADLKARVEKLGRSPRLFVLWTGDDPATRLYILLKRKAARRVGIEFTSLHLNKATKAQVLQSIEVANNDKQIDGILVQLPLEGELDSREIEQEIFKKIRVTKDVDGLRDDSPYAPATVSAVMYAIEEAIRLGCLPNPRSRIACVVGATGTVGRGVVRDLKLIVGNILKCNSKTSKEDLDHACREADVIVCATGVPGIIKKDMVKKGAVVIDVGSPKAEVEHDVREVASFITPARGGIGPATVISLIENVVEAAQRRGKVV